MKTKSHATTTSKNNWGSLSDDNSVITFDDIIDAYQDGCRDGLEKYIVGRRKSLSENLQGALPVLEKFFNDVTSPDDTSNFMTLKVAGINHFKIIITLDSVIFSDDALCKPIYEKSFEFKKNHPNISISFMPFAGSVNKDALLSDDYLLYYGSSFKS